MKIDKTALAIAETHHFTLGAPRTIQLSPDGQTVYFSRSDSGTSNVHALWKLDRITNKEVLLFDPLKVHSQETLTAEEEKQRERLRETSFGVTQYQLSEDGARLCFSYHGQLWFLETKGGKPKKIKQAVHVFDPRFSPDGTHIAYVTTEGLWVVEAAETAEPKLLVNNESDDKYWGQAEFAASEEFERYRAFWWSPDGKHLAATFVDETPIEVIQGVSDDSFEEPMSFRYPVAGTANASVTLFVINLQNQQKTEVAWDQERYPYLVNVQWKKPGLYLTVQSRDQKKLMLLQADERHKTHEVLTQTDRQWVDVLQPLPYVTPEGQVITTSGKTLRRLAVDGKAITSEELHVDDFIGVYKDVLIYIASPDPKERVVYATTITSGETIALTPEGGIFNGSVYPEGIYVTGKTMNEPKRKHYWLTDTRKKPQSFSLVSHVSKSPLTIDPIFRTVGPEKLETCLLLPKDASVKHKVPVILQVYGGPHHQEVMFNKTALQEAAWFTTQGYAVLMVDGPGTPGRSLTWEKLIYHDLITPVAEAQMTALKEILKQHPELDGLRVATRGWSFGGYLSAFLSVLYPRQIKAAIVGAPVTDWRLYDTHYTERYLGDPTKNKQAYEKSSLLKAARTATQPMLLIHGFNDDNVVIAHSLQLLKSLTKANCSYNFIPLVGASHFSKQAEQNALLLQMELNFLNNHLS